MPSSEELRRRRRFWLLRWDNPAQHGAPHFRGGRAGESGAVESPVDPVRVVQPETLPPLPGELAEPEAAAPPVAAASSWTSEFANDIFEPREQLERRFFEDCGGFPGLSISVRAGGSTTSVRVPLVRGAVVVGSHPSCGLRLVHDAVQPQQFVIQWLDGWVGYQKLSLPRTDSFSTGNQRGEARSPLNWWRVGQMLSLGPYRLRLENDEPSLIQPPRDWKPRQRNEWWSLIGSEDRRPPIGGPVALGRELTRVQPIWLRPASGADPFRLSRRLVWIGRSETCDVVLRHGSVAARHAAILQLPSGTWLVNCSHPGSLRWNGQAVSIARVSPGDDIDFGDVAVNVERAPRGAGPTAPLRS